MSTEESEEYWGEYSEQSEHESEILSLEFKKLLVQGAMDMDTDRPEAVPDDSNNSYAIRLPAEIGAMDETVLHTIMLQPYIQNIERLIRDVSDSNDIDDLNPPVVPPVPEKPPTIRRRRTLPLSKENAKYLLRKSCATIVCHVGYSSAKTAALDTLVDVADDFLRRMADRIRTAVDQTSRTGPSGFAYPLLRVLTEMGVDPLGLRDHYHVQVREHNAALYKSARLLHGRCVDLVRSRVSERIRELRERGELEEEENIPELHFPALGEDQLQSSLEPGFQMLDSLEHDESLQNMEADEEIVVSDSPSREYVHSASSDFSSPTDTQKAKRRKLV